MKRIILILITLIIIILLCSCNSIQEDTKNSDGILTVIYNNGMCLIYRDNRTGVQYIFRADSGGCVMLNADGKPYIEEVK